MFILRRCDGWGGGDSPFLPRFSYLTSIEDTLKVQAIFRFFFVYLTSRASDTLKVQTDYLTFGNLITTSDTPKVQSSEAIALNP